VRQVRKELGEPRVARAGETGEPLWCGLAEIWLENEKEQLESLQSKEFLEGARLDEPNWAAFWRTVGLDTTAHELLPGPPQVPDSGEAKLLVLSKRREGLPLDSFRSHCLGTHAAKLMV